jgi:hypothetical protein
MSFSSRKRSRLSSLFLHHYDECGNILSDILLDRRVWHRRMRQHQEGGDDFGAYAWLLRNRCERYDVARFRRGRTEGMYVAVVPNNAITAAKRNVTGRI